MLTPACQPAKAGVASRASCFTRGWERFFAKYVSQERQSSARYRAKLTERFSIICRVRLVMRLEGRFTGEFVSVFKAISKRGYLLLQYAQVAKSEASFLGETLSSGTEQTQ
ncbi:hypothetical protein V1478_008317 [Vespula squamosa]|uniref:Uncharacterized protein n=1 Tax=Vespula squamosa TaxID=30214 RepID=A0ABD2AYF0_VESSQ